MVVGGPRRARRRQSGRLGLEPLAAVRSSPRTRSRPGGPGRAPTPAARERLEVGWHEHDQRVDSSSRGLRVQPEHRRARWPVTNATDAATPRWVTGIPAAAGAARAALTPGITRTGIPARSSARTSSPPRPKRNGSPPLSRTTRLPSRAAAIIASLMLVCEAERRPPRLPTSISRARGPQSRSTSGLISASWNTTSASARTARVPMVSRSGSPGPAPARTTSPIAAASVGVAGALFDRQRKRGSRVGIPVAEHRCCARSKQPPVRALLRAGRHAGAAQPSSHPAHELRERSPLGAKRCLDSLAQRAGEKWALPGRRDGHLQRASFDERRCDPVALMGHVRHVEQHALAICLGSSFALCIRIVTRIDCEVRAHEVARLERAPKVDDGRSVVPEP